MNLKLHCSRIQASPRPLDDITDLPKNGLHNLSEGAERFACWSSARLTYNVTWVKEGLDIQIGKKSTAHANE